METISQFELINCYNFFVYIISFYWIISDKLVLPLPKYQSTSLNSYWFFADVYLRFV